MKELTLFDGKGMKVNDDGMVSLTDIWNANGGESRNRPKAWLETQQAQDFVAEVVKGQNPALFLKVAGVVKSEDIRLFLKVAKGRNGGTYAHWQIALAYAQFLSPELHVAVNTVFKGFVEADASIATSVLERTTDQQAVESIALKAIDKTDSPEALSRQELRARTKYENKSLNAAIKECTSNQFAHSMVADLNNVSITGMKAKEFREVHNLPAKASTRDHLTTHQMTVLAFQEFLEASTLRSQGVKGTKAVLSTVKETISSVQTLVRNTGAVGA